MRIYSNAYELMSEQGRNLCEMGTVVAPHSYQNKRIEGNEDYLTKEVICEHYCLTSLEQEEALFVFDKDSKRWAALELIERLNHNISINPGEAWKARKEVWEEFLNDSKQFDYTYNERLWFKNDAVANLHKVIVELQTNPDTRQAVVPIFHATDVAFLGGKRRIPCSMYYDFLIRPDVNGNPQLNITYHQRSSDFVTHFGNDVYLAWKTAEYVAKKVGVKMGYLYHIIDSLHTYKKDWDLLKTPVSQLLKR